MPPPSASLQPVPHTAATDLLTCKPAHVTPSKASPALGGGRESSARPLIALAATSARRLSLTLYPEETATKHLASSLKILRLLISQCSPHIVLSCLTQSRAPHPSGWAWPTAAGPVAHIRDSGCGCEHSPCPHLPEFRGILPADISAVPCAFLLTLECPLPAPSHVRLAELAVTCTSHKRTTEVMLQ